MKKERILLLSLFFFVVALVVGGLAFDKVQAQTPGETDAIAIRIIPNPGHYSPMDWYYKQGYTAKPESLTVDGYEAVRAGRTVYVNVANVVNRDVCIRDTVVETCVNCQPYMYALVPPSAFSGLTAACFEGPTGYVNTVADMDYRVDAGNVDVTNCANGAAPNIDFYCLNAAACPSTPSYCGGCDRRYLKIAYSGNLNITTPGEYMFATLSDDESDFSIGGSFYASYPPQGATPLINTRDTRSFGPISLTAGNHGFTYRMSNYTTGGGARAEFYWITPGNLASQNAIRCSAGHTTPVPCTGSEDIRTTETIEEVVPCSGPFTRIVPGAPSIYTNIYIISYTQEGTPETAQIFDEILKHWRFNTNMTTTNLCFNQEDTTEVCLVDDDCSGGGFCNSAKAQITRDTERLGNVVHLREAIDNYRDERGNFPKLDSGTYLPGKTISTWPSWSQEFSRELGIPTPSDPVNQMGDCGSDDYDEETCWDDENKTFADPEPADSELDLPVGSNALVYEVMDNGESYSMCAYMESGVYGLLGGEFGSCSASTRENRDPGIDCGTLIGFEGEAFTGHVTASDPDGDPVDIDLAGLDAQFTYYAEPSKKQVTINGASPGSGGSPYNFTVTAEDIYGASVSKTCSIVIETGELITYPVTPISSLIGEEFGFTVYTYHSQGDYDGINFIFGPGPISACDSIELTKDGRYKCEARATIDTVGSWSVTVHTQNAAGDTSDIQWIDINVYNDPPVINAPLNCETETRIGQPYTACRITAADPNGHSIDGWDMRGDPGVPAGLLISGAGEEGTIAGIPGDVGTFRLSVRAQDEFGAWSEEAHYTLEVNNYCGDTIRQEPNTEGRGGPADDGYEACDGADGTPTPAESNVSWQYGCDDSCRSLNDGYCGDGVEQTGYGEWCDDGNEVSGDGCNSRDSACETVCNDGELQTPNSSGTGGPAGDGNEECDYGVDNNCCSNCSFTASDTEWVPWAGDDTLANGESMTINLPNCQTYFAGTDPYHPHCRGIVEATFDATLLPYGAAANPEEGTAIVFITDISGSMFDPAYEATKATMHLAIDRFYNEANASDINIHVGTLATYSNTIGREINISNLNDTYGGLAHADDLHDSITTYASMGDPPNFHDSYASAHQMLANYPYAAPGEKYIIILTDGYPPYSGTAATDAKADDVKVYTIAFHFWEPAWPTAAGNTAACLRSLCNISSDDGNVAVCYTDSYARRKPTDSVVPAVVEAELGDIYDGIINQILARMPDNITFTIGGATTDLVTFDDVSFVIPGLSCDMSGGSPCTPNPYTMTVNFIGTGEIQFNDFRYNMLVPCEE